MGCRAEHELTPMASANSVTILAHDVPSDSTGHLACCFRVHHGRALWQKILIRINLTKSQKDGHSLNISSKDMSLMAWLPSSWLYLLMATPPLNRTAGCQPGCQHTGLWRMLETEAATVVGSLVFSCLCHSHFLVQDNFLGSGWEFNALNSIVTATVAVFCFQPAPALMEKTRLVTQRWGVDLAPRSLPSSFLGMEVPLRSQFVLSLSFVLPRGGSMLTPLTLDLSPAPNFLCFQNWKEVHTWLFPSHSR